MRNGRLDDFWQPVGDDVDNVTRRLSDASRVLVEVSRGNTIGEEVQRQIEEHNYEVDSTVESLVNRFISKLEKENWINSGYYVSDVYACESARRAVQLANELAQRTTMFRRGIILISVHGDHVHTIHSCPYSNRSCRCNFNKFKEAQEDIRRRLRSPRSLEAFQRQDWYNITKYFCTNGRRTTYCKVGGLIQRLPGQITDISNARICQSNGEGSDPSLEVCHDPIYDDIERGRAIDGKDSGNSLRRNKRRAPTAGGGTIGGVSAVILGLLNRYAICPLSEIVHTKEYLEAVCCLKRLDDKDVKSAIDTRASIINLWFKEDYDSFYNDPATIKIWSARSLDLVDMYYLSWDETINIIKELLTFQCGAFIYLFCKQLVDVLEMKIPKRNTFVVISPPSAGKNFFFDAIRDYYLNSGQICNPNKYNNFAYQDCNNRRLCIWNEPNYEPREIENLKMLLGGDNMSANVKMKPQANIKRTPIIVTGNIEPRFCRDDAFTDRIYHYNWQPAPFLKDVKKKPRPDATMYIIYELCNTYIEI